MLKNLLKKVTWFLYYIFTEGKFTTEQAKAREYASSVRNNTEEAMKNLKNGIDFLKTREDVNSEKLAFCWLVFWWWLVLSTC